MTITEIIRRYMMPVFEKEGEGSGGGAGDGGDDGTNDDAGNGDDTQGDDTQSATGVDPVLGAGSTDGGDDDADEGEGASDETSDDKDGDDDEGENPDDDVVPGEGEDYTFEAPEGMEIDEDMAAAMSPLFKQIGITQGQANQLVAAYGAQIAAGAEAQANAFVDRITGWTEAARNDTEIGGDKWDATVAAANGALQKLGTPELTQALQETGMSNHPEVIRFMHRTALALGIDNFDPGENVDTGDVPTEEAWYGKTTPTSKKA